MANYETYNRAHLKRTHIGPLGYIIVVMLVFTFFGMYELLGIVFAKIIDSVNKLAHPDIPQDHNRL